MFFYISKKTLYLAMRELENPKMVNEISLKSLRGPMTPCRASGQVIFLIFPRKKAGKLLPVCTLQARAIKIFKKYYDWLNAFSKNGFWFNIEADARF